MWLSILAVLLSIVIAFLLFWKFWFLRKPDRLVPEDGIVSPANGKIVRIVEFSNGEPVDIPKGLLATVRAMTKDVAKSGYLIVIMLTPLDVHYQRAPCAGTIKSITYTPGGFGNAVLGASKLSAFTNERNEILIQDGKTRMKIVQVAGVAARRIRCDVVEGETVKKGDILGLINFGSQVYLVLPKRKLNVRVGEKVIDAETVIA